MNEVIGAILMTVGVLFDLFGCIGLVRLPDVYNRLQAATKCVTLGTIFLLVGVAVGSGWGPTAAKAIICALFILVTSPTAAHAIAKGAYASGVELWENSVVDKYAAEVDKQLVTLPRQAIARESLKRFGAIFVVKGLDAAIELANRIAPEHLELLITEPFEYVGRIRNAGAVFLGHFTPEPIGDYIAGPNHVLPTAGTARFASALSVDHFP